MTTIGIDLGTTNSACAVWQDDRAVLIPNRLGKFLTPSVISFDDDGSLLVGETARNRLVTHPDLTTSLFKRYMGSEHKASLNNRAYSPVELSSIILKSLKEDAENHLGHPVTRAVISVPAYFNDLQREATRAAGRLAGLEVERLINEPTAAAMMYGLQSKADGTQFLVLDLGGGTFDVTLVEYFDGVLEVHASAGDNHLGGEDFLDVLADNFFQANDISSNSLTKGEKQRILAELEKAKIQLSTQEAITLNGIIEKQKAPWQLDRERFEQLMLPLLRRIQLPIKRAVQDADIELDEIDEVILVGGATRMPVFRSMVSRTFRRFPMATIDPDLVVAMGAAIQAGLKDQHAALDDVVLTDVSPYSMGVEIINHADKRGKQSGIFDPIIERNSTVPVSIEKTFCTVRDQQQYLTLNIYQGESRLVQNNVLLGSMEVRVPKNRAGKEMVDVRFSYDMSGLLEVDVSVCSTGEVWNKSIVNSPGDISEEALETSRQKLAQLKFHPRDQEVNRAELARANHLYETSLGARRQYIGKLIGSFESELNQQQPDQIRKARKAFTQELDLLEDDGVLF